MKAFAQTLELKDDPALIAEYRQWHEHVWPEVLEALHGIGIEQMRIYLFGNRLFMYAEAADDFDPVTAYQSYASSGKAKAWDEKMRAYQQRVPGAADEGWWTTMDLVFDLAAQRGQAGLS